MTIALFIRRLMLASLLLGIAARATADERALYIAAASDLAYCLPELERAFERQRPGITIKTSFGASGNFVAQIRKGAPFDVFMSADESYPGALVRESLAQADTLLHYATGHIALWSAQPLPDINNGLMILTRPKFRRIAIANPDHAPYGKAARRALEAAGIWSAIDHKIVRGENITQTLQFVQSGHAEIGIVAVSLLKQPALAGTRYFEIPQHYYAPIKQYAVVTRRGDWPIAREFVLFLATPEAQAIFARFGLKR